MTHGKSFFLIGDLLSTSNKDIRIMELLEQNRQLQARYKRVDEYDEVVDLNDSLMEALRDIQEVVKETLSEFSKPLAILKLEWIEKTIDETIAEGDK